MRNPLSFLGIFIFCSFLASESPAQLLRTHHHKNDHFDARHEVAADLAAGTALTRAGLEANSTRAILAWKSRFTEARRQFLAARRDLMLDANPYGWAPEVVGVVGDREFLTPASLATREDILRGYLARHAGLFGITSAEVKSLRKISDYTNPSGNLSWVELGQRIGGLPVFQGEIRAAFTRKGELARLTGNLASGLADVQLPKKPALGPVEAVIAGAKTVRDRIDPTAFRLLHEDPAEFRAEVSAGPFDEKIEARLMIFPLAPGVARLAWAMTLWGPVEAHYVLVDAQDGSLLFRKNITCDQTQPATYSVYDNDSPAPLSPTTVLPGSGTQAPLISRSSISVISELSAYNNLGWITDGGTTTTGNNCDAGLDVVSPNGIDTGGRPVSATRNFTYTYNPGPGSPAPGGAATDADFRNGVVTNLFFWTNRYHDRLYSLGFTEAARNFQTSNFGRNPGGATANAIAGNDEVRAEAQDYSGTDNANFATPADGAKPRMQMYLFTTPNPARDGSLDGDIVLHELTHGLSNRLHNNGSGLTTTQAGSLGEGWSDFYARCLLSTADEDIDGVYASGAYATYLLGNSTDNYYYGIRRFPYASWAAVGSNGKPHNPLTYGDIDGAQMNLSDGAFPANPLFAGSPANEVHAAGEVWCMMLLEMRAALLHKHGYAIGNQLALQLVTDAMKLDPSSPTFLQAASSILAADAASNAGANLMDIRRAFALRGMGAGATASGFTVVESFSPDLVLGSVTWSDLYGNGNGIPDSGEDIRITVPLTNGINVSSPSVRATIGAFTASYGDLASGASATRVIPFRIPAGAACGSFVSIPITYASDHGTATYQLVLQLGTPNYAFTETFDGVTAPALPSGWTTTVASPAGGKNGTPWVTVTSPVVDAANNVFTPDLAGAGSGGAGGEASVVSPSIAIGGAGRILSFRHTYDTEGGYDGGVLEIAIAGGGFTDIVTAGGSFIKGGYTSTVSNSYGNPIGGRSCWTGTGTGISTLVSLPAAAAGQNVQFRWRLGFDNQVKGTGWNVDSVRIISSYSCTSVDADNDGLQDGFEMANGLDKNDPNDANLDADGDGQTNLEEFLSGTGPQDATSALRITQSGFSAVSGSTLSFPSVTGKTYRVEYKNALTDASWTLLQDNVPGTGSDVVLTDASASSQDQRFYRVTVLP